MVWVTADGVAAPLAALDGNHLQNIIRHVQNQAKVSAIRNVIEMEAAGVVPPPSFDWRDFLPRYYDHLIDEATVRRNTGGVLDGMQRPSHQWLERWYDPDVVYAVEDWMQQHPRSNQAGV